MGIETSAVIIVGLERRTVENAITEDKLDDLLDYGKLDVAAPYDCHGNDDAIVGIIYAGAGECAELDYDPVEIIELKMNFKEVTGLDGRVWLAVSEY